MLNDCIRIGLDKNVTSLRSLTLKAYPQLIDYDVMGGYKLCAISRAAGILRNYRKARKASRRVKEPYSRRLQLVTCYGFKIVNGKLMVPSKRRQPIAIPLNSHTISVLSQPSITVRSITLTESKVAITFAKEAVTIQPEGVVGLDRNLDNVTSADSDGSIEHHNLTKTTELKTLYREIKSHVTRNDTRVRGRICLKYGRRQRNRVQLILHQTSKRIVEEAKQKRFAIAMEKLLGIRRLYRKGNGQGCEYRARMNSWSYAELQRQVEYKAR